MGDALSTLCLFLCGWASMDFVSNAYSDWYVRTFAERAKGKISGTPTSRRGWFHVKWGFRLVTALLLFEWEDSIFDVEVLYLLMPERWLKQQLGAVKGKVAACFFVVVRLQGKFYLIEGSLFWTHALLLVDSRKWIGNDNVNFWDSNVIYKNTMLVTVAGFLLELMQHRYLTLYPLYLL